MAKRRGNYGVFYPSQNFNPGERFFFFTTLLNKDDGQPGKQGSDLAQEVNSYIDSNFNIITNQNSDNDISLMQQSMDFLKTIIERTRLSEQQYFTEHIFKNNNMSLEMKKDFEQCFKNDGSIDYLKFIEKINLFYTGTKNYQYLLSNEVDRLKEVNQMIKEFKSLSQKKRKEYMKKENKKNDSNEKKEYYDNFFLGFSRFLVDKIYSINDSSSEKEKMEAEVAQRVLSTKTTINQIQEGLKQVFFEIWNSDSFREKISNTILWKTGDSETLKQEILLAALSDFMLSAPEKVSEILKTTVEKEDQNGDKKIVLDRDRAKKLATAFVNTVIGKENFDEEIFIDLELQQLLERAHSLEKEQESQDKVKKRLFKQANTNKIMGFNVENKSSIIEQGSTIEKTRSKGGIQGLTKDLISILGPIVEQELEAKKLKVSRASNKNNKKKTARAALIENLIRLASTEGNKGGIKIREHKKINYNALESYIKKKIKSTNAINIKIRRNDNVLSEINTSKGIIKGIQRKTSIFSSLTDGYQKSDTSIIDLGEYIITPDIPESLWGELAEDFIKKFNESNKISYVEIKSNKSYYNEMEDRANENREGGSFTDNEFFLKGETQRRITLLESAWDTVEKQLREQNKSAEEIQQALEKLKSSFKVSSSVKSYDKYDNDVGFHGGSIGGSVEHQIENLYQMFEYGGITLPDIKWMIFSVYNAGPGMLGNRTKAAIENIFSTLAVTLLFDDAGEQANYIKEQAYNNYGKPSTNFIHLYNLNGFYFPESYILELTYQGMQEAQKQLTTYIGKTGSRANIINPVHQGHMKGRIPKKGKNEKSIGNKKVVTSEKDWYDTFNQNKEKVSISITFLAGFLDILEKLENAMTQINTKA